MEHRCYLLKWRKDRRHYRCSTFEVRPMPVYVDNRYNVLEEDLSFEDANTKRKELEALENQNVK